MSDGVAATSLATIAAHAGISRSGLLKHFATFEVILEEIGASFAVVESAVMRTPVGAQEADADGAGYSVLSAQLLSTGMAQRTPASAATAHHRDLLAQGAPADVASKQTELETATSAQRCRTQVALWEGLHVLSCFFPDLSPRAMFYAVERTPRQHERRMFPLTAQPVPFESLLTPDAGYAPGRLRRAQIITDATRVFAQQGFHGTTVRDLAAAVGVSASTLLHHVGDKTRLLAEVLRHRDEELVSRRGGVHLEPVIELAQLGAEARRDLTVEPGLINLYARLSTEATAAHHPAHAYFAERYARTIAYFENVIERVGQTIPGLADPRAEAIHLVALWDGLQFQHVLDPGSVDIPTFIDAYIDGLFDDPTPLRRARKDAPDPRYDRQSGSGISTQNKGEEPGG